MIYNVHCLIHLADDCIHFKRHLEFFSAFPFENFLGQLTKMITGKKHALQQLVRRLAEHDHLEDSGFAFGDLKKFNSTMADSVNTSRRSDSFFILNETVVRVKVLPSRTSNRLMMSQMKLVANGDGSPVDFSTDVFKSTGLGIYVASNSEDDKMISVDVDYFNKNAVKCTFLPYNEKKEERFLAIPLLHTT